MVREVANHLLDGVCPSIEYRVRSEVLGEPTSTQTMARLQERILQDETVKAIISSQQPDGWLGTGFHCDGGAEVGVRVLLEKGVRVDHPVNVRALKAMSGSEETFARELFNVGRILDRTGLGGSRLIRAVVFAYAGMEDTPFVSEQVGGALEAFQAVLAVQSLLDITEDYRGTLVFRAGAKWPSIYHLRLLAFTSCWRTRQNEAVVRESVSRLVKLSPIPYARIRNGYSHLIVRDGGARGLEP